MENIVVGKKPYTLGEDRHDFRVGSMKLEEKKIH
jgi:hypothetical protein